MTREFRRNHRLRWVFRICHKLGIDDPIYWMEMVDPKVVDLWIAYLIVEDEDKSSRGKSAEDMQEELMGAFNV